jgi:small subunit ribosomal protein S9
MIDNQDLVVTSSIGKRKQAVAFVSLCKPVNNQPVTLINELPAPLYLQFNSKFLNTIYLPLEILDLKNKFTICIQVKGGGLSGQTDAIKLAIAKALCDLNKEHRPVLKSYGFLTRDSRIKESKKYGLKKARKASQFSKR